MRIPWRFKSTIFKILATFGAGRTLFFLQKYLTRTTSKKYREVSPNWILHENAIKTIEGVSVELLEFGAGKSLVQNLYLDRVFCGKLNQTVVDIQYLLNMEMVRDANTQICNLLGIEVENKKFNLGMTSIVYEAPMDVCSIGSGVNSTEYDLCVSTNTLEHIPEDDILKIFTHLKTILKTNGLVSAKIDYTDHYSYTDNAIHPLNFLKYTEAEWVKYNTYMHYQNRLRHQEYRELFVGMGYSVVQEHVTRVCDAKTELHSDALAANEETWILHGYFLLRNRRP